MASRRERVASLTATQKAQLLSDCIHAAVVMAVVVCTTILTAWAPHSIPNDVVGAVFGGAIGYAAGRAGSGTRAAGAIPGGRRAEDE